MSERGDLIKRLIDLAEDGPEAVRTTCADAADVIIGVTSAVTKLKQQKADLLAALIALRQAAKDSPSMQGRDFVSLGIQVNNAIARAGGVALTSAQQDPAA